MRPESEYPEAQQMALNMGLIQKVANRGYAMMCAAPNRRNDLEFEDLVSECQIIFMKARDKFDPGMGYQFSTYFYVAAWNRLKAILLKPVVAEVHVEEMDLIDYDSYGYDIGMLTCETFLDSLGAADRMLVDGYLFDEADEEDGKPRTTSFSGYMKSHGYSAGQVQKARERIRLAAYKTGMYDK